MAATMSGDQEAHVHPVNDSESELNAFHKCATSPRNWTWTKKWACVLVLAITTFVTCLAPAIFAPALDQTAAELRILDGTLKSLVVSVYVLGWASGPILVSPLSELYGRLWVYHTTNVLFVGFTLACAASQNLAMLIAFRFLAGSAGSAVLNIGAGTIADMFAQEERGLAMAVWTVGALLGPITGPIIGGFLAVSRGSEDEPTAETQRVNLSSGWRWTFWLIAILATLTTVLFAAVMRETYAPVLIARRRGLSSTGGRRSHWSMFWFALKRPILMLVFSPIILISSLYIALVFGYQYLLITTIPTTFATTYGFSTGSLGLVYLGLGIGMLASTTIFGLCSDRLLQRLARRSTEKRIKPEFRLVTMWPGTVLVPTGLFLYGWSVEAKLPWIVPIIGTAFLGAGLNGILMSLQTYLIDAYVLYAASAMAANTIIRSAAGALLPLAGPDMFHALGIGWGSSILGFVALLFTPMPFVLIRYGELWRAKSRFTQK